MDTGEREQIELLTERALQRGKEKYDAEEQLMFAEHSAKGILGSGSTIKRAVQIMGEVGALTLNQLLTECDDVSKTSEAYSLIEETLSALLDDFHQRLPRAIGMGTRMKPGEGLIRVSEELFSKMRADIEADIKVARFGYLKSDMPQAPNQETVRRAPKNTGGKPLAEHWDSMWAEIAIQLWTGDLQPKKQADIKAAMFEWLNANEIEASDTAVTGRARALWKRWQTAQ